MMEAGRELDVLMAEKVMGLDVLGKAACWPSPECCSEWFIDIGYLWFEQMGGGLDYVYLDECCCESKEMKKYHRDDPRAFGHYSGCMARVADYSTDISAAWEVLERIRSEDPFGLFVRFIDAIAEEFDADQGYYQTDLFNVLGNIGPRAICLAARKAVKTDH